MGSWGETVSAPIPGPWLEGRGLDLQARCVHLSLKGTGLLTLDPTAAAPQGT